MNGRGARGGGEEKEKRKRYRTSADLWRYTKKGDATRSAVVARTMDVDAVRRRLRDVLGNLQCFVVRCCLRFTRHLRENAVGRPRSSKQAIAT